MLQLGVPLYNGGNPDGCAQALKMSLDDCLLMCMLEGLFGSGEKPPGRRQAACTAYALDPTCSKTQFMCHSGSLGSGARATLQLGPQSKNKVTEASD